MNLNSNWKLYYFIDSSIEINNVSELETKEIPCINATVPGNVELDLSAAGVLPEDLFKGMNSKLTWEYEKYEWWYTRDFVPDSPKAGQRVVLCFHAVDTIADYYLNGEKIGHSENMFIEHKFDVTDKLLYGQTNTLHVNIKSPRAFMKSQRVEPIEYLNGSKGNSIQLIRKADHSFGWDIMPRIVSAGIWRDVELEYVDDVHFRFVYFSVNELWGNTAVCQVIYDVETPLEEVGMWHKVAISGRCGDYEFNAEDMRFDSAGTLCFNIPQKYLWWPRNYGKQNMFDLTLKIYKQNGELLVSKDFRQGFRKVELLNSEIIEPCGKFEFHINDKKVIALGTNWVPMDAFHSRDKSRYAKALELVEDIGCNIIRCWGGNVYEDDEFYQFCDEHGIMIWQDFSIACRLRPLHDEFAKRLEEEVTSVVEKLRNYASIVLWCGDNEVDACFKRFLKPSDNRINRKTIPELLIRLDPRRPYLPSSPYVSDKAYPHNRDEYSEIHIWDPRDYYKNNRCMNTRAYFISEIGYHGCPAKKSIEKFIDEDKVWPYFDNEQWNLHSSDQRNNSGRTMLMHHQIEQVFGTVPDNLEDFVTASQISQAEAYKFFIERLRARTDSVGGIIWWNLLDGWPQMSDAVVDYYYEKKLAYSFIKRSSVPVLVFVGEKESRGYPVLISNCSANISDVRLKITDVETNKVVFESEAEVESNTVSNLGKIPFTHSQQGMLLIEYVVDGKQYVNSYLYGTPRYDLAQYHKWLSKIENAENNTN